MKAINQALVAGGNADARKVFKGTGGIVAEGAVLLVGEAQHVLHPHAAGFDAVQHLTKSKVALAAHEKVPQARVLPVRDALRKQSGVIAAQDGFNTRIELPGQMCKADRGLVLKGHRTEAYDIRFEGAQQFEKARDRLLAPDHHVDNAHIVIVDLSGKG